MENATFLWVFLTVIYFGNGFNWVYNHEIRILKNLNPYIRLLMILFWPLIAVFYIVEGPPSR